MYNYSYLRGLCKGSSELTLKMRHLLGGEDLKKLLKTVDLRSL